MGQTRIILLPYSDKRKQLLEMTFLVNEQNVSVMYIDINAISLYLDWNIFQQDERFCSKLGMEEECAKSNLKTSLSLVWVICELLPFVRVGQTSMYVFLLPVSQYSPVKSAVQLQKGVSPSLSHTLSFSQTLGSHGSLGSAIFGRLNKWN